MQERVLAIARELLPIPTAPFREEAVREYVLQFCRKRSIRVTPDRMGNLVATYGPQFPGPILAFSAHMDHPGFIVEADSSRRRTTALFYGSVEPRYFRDARVLFFTRNGTVPGTITRTEAQPKRRTKRVWIRLEGDVRRGDAGMWSTGPVRVRSGKLYSRWCDDGAGCVSVLALLDELRRRTVRKKVMAVFTVAEEAGFHGVKYLCVHKRIPKSVNLIAIEASSELPTARIGDGVVIRVGDRKSIFTPAVTAFMTSEAERLATDDACFRYQRKLMDGGTCESTVYNAFGHLNGAVCVPLGNYHNRDTRRGRIAAEYVSVDDLTNMVRLFVQLVRQSASLDSFVHARSPSYEQTHGDLGEHFLRG